MTPSNILIQSAHQSVRKKMTVDKCGTQRQKVRRKGCMEDYIDDILIVKKAGNK